MRKDEKLLIPVYLHGFQSLIQTSCLIKTMLMFSLGPFEYKLNSLILGEILM